jgi:hypothetical protein
VVRISVRSCSCARCRPRIPPDIGFVIVAVLFITVVNTAITFLHLMSAVNHSNIPRSQQQHGGRTICKHRHCSQASPLPMPSSTPDPASAPLLLQLSSARKAPCSYPVTVPAAFPATPPKMWFLITHRINMSTKCNSLMELPKRVDSKAYVRLANPDQTIVEPSPRQLPCQNSTHGP